MMSFNFTLSLKVTAERNKDITVHNISTSALNVKVKESNQARIAIVYQSSITNDTDNNITIVVTATLSETSPMAASDDSVGDAVGSSVSSPTVTSGSGGEETNGPPHATNDSKGINGTLPSTSPSFSPQQMVKDTYVPSIGF